MSDTQPFRLAIIGGGPNALYLLERAYNHLRAGGGPRGGLEVHVFDRAGAFGSGTHYTQQPTTNHLNRVADQISFGADRTHASRIAHLPRVSEQATLYSWCRERYCETNDERYDIGPREWVDRALFGEASQSVMHKIVAGLRALGAGVTLHIAEVVDLEPRAETGYTVYAQAADGEIRAEADFVALCTGHGANRIAPDSLEARLWAHAARVPNARYLDHVYPIEGIGPDDAAPGEPVALRGLGLAALDVILRLTEGRGGYFVRRSGDERGLGFVPGGFEPSRILPFSETGVFVFVRAYNQKLNDESLFHKGVFFTTARIDQLRAAFGQPRNVPHVGVVRQLDFDRHLLPVMVLETALIHTGALFGSQAKERFITDAQGPLTEFVMGDDNWGQAPDSLATAPLAAVRRLAEAVRSVVIDGCQAPDATVDAAARAFLRFCYGARNTEAIANLPAAEMTRRLAGSPSPFDHDPDPLAHLFNWSRLIDPLAGMEHLSRAQRREAARDWLRRDVLDARQGNIDNPRKAAIDGVWRDLRDTLRYAVEFGGLTASSHARFAGAHCRMINRIAVGTSLKVMEKIRALAEHGILDLSLTRRPRLALDEQVGFHLSGGPDPEDGETCRVLMNARVHKFDLQLVDAVLFVRLRERGLLRAWRNPAADGGGFRPGGIDIVPQTQLAVDARGRPDPRIAVLGPPTEGPLYFHIAAARPYCDDPVIVDAEQVIAHAFGLADAALHPDRVA